MGVQQEIEAVYEDSLDALRAAVQALGGAKAVAGWLYPNMPIAQAHRDVLDALNRERQRKFDIEEVLQILRRAREIGFHSAKHFIDAETGYQKTAPANPRDEISELQAQFIEMGKQLARIAERIERLTRTPLEAVSGGKS